jgi:mannose-6-phosphate isomerase class I
MWYDAGRSQFTLIVGFKESSNAQEYLKHLEDKTLLSILDSVPVKVGDVFFLETGTVHAIGAGLVIAEIQQTSDITYRIYDFDRVDADGNTRELHIDLALDAINYERVEAKKTYKKSENQSNVMVDCQYFTTNYIALNGKMEQQKTAARLPSSCVPRARSILSLLAKVTRTEKATRFLSRPKLRRWRLWGTRRYWKFISNSFLSQRIMCSFAPNKI